MGDKNRWRVMLLFGMPGSGKGTQGRAIGSLPGFLHISSGDIFRQLYKAGPLGREVDRYTSVGKLVPDDLTVQIWQNHMEFLIRKNAYKPESQIIIADGIPRTFEQARLLSTHLDVLRIYYLKVPDIEEAVDRIRRRALAEGRVDDADEKVIRGRMDTFFTQTADTIRFYEESLVSEINASESAISVLAELARDISIVTESSAVPPLPR